MVYPYSDSAEYKCMLNAFLDAISKSAISNQILKVRDGFETANLENWQILNKDSCDYIFEGGNTAGASYVNISKCLCPSTRTVLLSKFIINGASRVALGMSLSQRKQQEVFKFGFVEVDDKGNPIQTMDIPEPVEILSYSQTGTTATITTKTPHNLIPGDRDLVCGVADSRACLGECVVATVTSPTVYTVTNLFDGTAITTGTINSTGGYSKKVDPLDFYDNSFGIGWVGVTATYAKFASRSNSSPFLATNQTTVGTTAATVGNSAAFCDSLEQTCDYDIRFKNEGITVRTFPSDASTAQTLLCKRTRVIPDISSNYKLFIVAENIAEKSSPVADIVSITKSGSTTATVVVDRDINLTTTDYIRLIGNYNQTNNAASATPAAVASVIDPRTFTVVWGTSTTGVSYGGSVVRTTGQQNGAGDGAVLPAIQSLAVDSNYITITANVTMASIVSIADTVELKGLVGTDGTDYSSYEGTYKAANVSTTTLVLYNNDLTTNTPKNTLSSTNMGGAIFKRSDLRLHSLRIFNWARITADIDAGNGTADPQEGVPVTLTSASVTATCSGAAAHDAAVSGSPLRIAGRALSANYATVSTGDTADLVTTLVGALVQKPYSIPDADWQYTNIITNNTSTAMKAAGSTGIRNYVTNMTFQNTNSTATEISILDGSTAIFKCNAPASMSTPVTIAFPTPLRGTAATAMNFQCTTTGANVYINTQGFQAP